MRITKLGSGARDRLAAARLSVACSSRLIRAVMRVVAIESTSSQ